MKPSPKTAYFSMEFALDPQIPNFAGGLGVLAADMMMSCADLNLPVVGVSLIYHLNEDPENGFVAGKHFEKLSPRVTVRIEDRQVSLVAWKHVFKGENGFQVPLYLLSTFLPENKLWDRDLTKNLYPSDQYTRLCQEALLGIGGVRMLRALGLHDLETFHMNEGHASLLILERLREEQYQQAPVKASCAFTTHTPIPAGHDRFPHSLAQQILGEALPWNIKELASPEELHTTKLALSMSHSANAVSQKHKEVCQTMFPQHDFLGITNGVHHGRWVVGAMRSLFDRHIKGWKKDPLLLKEALNLPSDKLQRAHLKNKKMLIDFINQQEDHFLFSHKQLHSDDYFDPDTLTITFSRRFVPYKRPLLLFHDLERLKKIAYRKLQIIYSGHCHPDDAFCNNVMAELHQYKDYFRGQLRLAVLPNRNLDTAELLVGGSDIWLNNPEPPMEASGTSGMKAALNGGLNLSVLDGWWLEAYTMDSQSGWAFGEASGPHDERDAEALYLALESIIDCYENHPEQWLERMKHAIALGAFFNTHRCAQEYQEKMWSPSLSPSSVLDQA